MCVSAAVAPAVANLGKTVYTSPAATALPVLGWTALAVAIAGFAVTVSPPGMPTAHAPSVPPKMARCLHLHGNRLSVSAWRCSSLRRALSSCLRGTAVLQQQAPTASPSFVCCGSLSWLSLCPQQQFSNLLTRQRCDGSVPQTTDDHLHV